MQRENQIAVIKNFDGALVSWSETYCRSAKQQGFDVRSEYNANDLSDKIFLGDKIPKTMGHAGCNIFFLGAADCSKRELTSIKLTDATTTVSSAEKKRIVNAFPYLNPDKISVDGFPIDLELLQGIKESTLSHNRKIDNSVCFLGRTDNDKGPNEEIEIVKALRDKGYNIFHLSGGKISISDKLNEMGVNVIEGISGQKYLELLSQMDCVVNTSPRESLFVSGLEASGVGVPVLAPLIEDSGIQDWNLAERLYDYKDISSVVKMIQEISSESRDLVIPDVSYYDKTAYFNRIRQLCDKVRNRTDYVSV
ncbi:MAG: hypothetical protein WCH58_01145 [Candidatus Saccharibacteria bacterium]